MRIPKKFTAMLCATAVGLVLSAQAAAQAVAPAEAAAEASDIVVTGTRLGLSGFSAPTPVTVLGTQQIDARAPSNIGDFLLEQPAFRSSSSPSQNQRSFGGGAIGVDLRGLGQTRTLTLVNGQRFTPSSSNGVLDVSLIPTLLVQRVDVVTGGASAAYGSDAVAGVVNFVLNNKLQGVKTKAQYNVSKEGDNVGPVLGLAAGTAFAGGRGHIIVGAEYASSTGIGRIYEREWGRNQPGLIANGSTRPAGTPAQSFVTGVTYSAQNPGGLITAGPLKGTAFGPGGTTFAFQYGTVFSNLMVGGDSYGNSPFGNWPIVTPTNRAAGMARLSYELGDDLEAFVEANYGRNEGTGYTSYNQRAFTISRDNYFLPASIRDQMFQRGLQTISVGRLFTENGGLQQSNTNETLRGLAGVKGHVFSTWDWDFNAQYGRSTRSTKIFGSMLGANYDSAVNAIAGPNGQPICGPTATNPNLNAAEIAVLTPGCVPVNIFGAGSPSDAAKAYILDTATSKTTYRRTALALNLRGSPFATGAGKVSVAVGAEYRHDVLANAADPRGAAGLYTSGNSSNFGGKQSVTEGFAEIGVPLLANVPLARSLDLNAAYRYTHYSTSGSVSTWKAGLTYEPTGWMRLRGTVSRDIRAPNLSELYASSPSGTSVASFVNPFNGATGALNASGAGNTLLVPEKADTLTGGIVLTPGAGVKLSVDGYRIKVKNVISNVGVSDIVNRCFAGTQFYCRAITFDNTAFGIANVAQQPVNLAQLETSGLDIELQYTRPVGSGTLNLRALATKVFTLKTTDASGTVNRAGALQSGGIPSWTGNLTIDYATGPLTLDLSARYISSSKFDALFVGPDSPNYNPAASNSINYNRFPAAVYFNLGTSVDVKSGSRTFQLFGGIDNLLDKQPPQFAAIGINSGGTPTTWSVGAIASASG